MVKSRKLRERPVSFGKMEDVKSVWENGVAKTKEELREERKQEIQQIRSRLFMVSLRFRSDTFSYVPTVKSKRLLPLEFFSSKPKTTNPRKQMEIN